MFLEGTNKKDTSIVTMCVMMEDLHAYVLHNCHTICAAAGVQIFALKVFGKAALVGTNIPKTCVASFTKARAISDRMCGCSETRADLCHTDSYCQRERREKRRDRERTSLARLQCNHPYTHSQHTAIYIKNQSNMSCYRSA